MKISPAQRQLAKALDVLKRLQDAGKTVFRSADFARSEREALTKNGFLRQIIKGWYMATRPDELAGDTTPWYAIITDFIREYCNGRFGDTWHASPEYSILLHVGNTIAPQQIVIYSPNAQNTLLDLPGGTSLLDYKRRDELVSSSRIEMIAGIRVMPLSLALIRTSEAFFRNYSRDAQIALHKIDSSELIRDLVEGGHSVLAGRLTGALRAIRREDFADEIASTLKSAGYSVAETNPFLNPPPELHFERSQSPYVLRMRLMWKEMREVVLATFPKEPGHPQDIERFMEDIEVVYVHDAYHSLSIEGYRVSDNLIRRVATGQWNPDSNGADEEAKNAMAAHGYWQAHNEVKATIRKIFGGTNPGKAYRTDHPGWYRALWEPSVRVGLLRPADLAGYRNDAVYIRNAAHVPPPKDAVRDMMPELCNLLEAEESAAVRAVLGHFLFVFTHPYMDGNGRLGRFLMNAMLASGGFSWTVIEKDRRKDYMGALDAASSRGDIEPFARFIYECMIASQEFKEREISKRS